MALGRFYARWGELHAWLLMISSCQQYLLICTDNLPALLNNFSITFVHIDYNI